MLSSNVIYSTKTHSKTMVTSLRDAAKTVSIPYRKIVRAGIEREREINGIRMVGGETERYQGKEMAISGVTAGEVSER